MKKIILLLAAFLILGTPVFALETSTTTQAIPQKREEIKQRIEEKRMELQSQIQEKREEVKKQILEKKSDVKTRLQILAQDRVSKILLQIFERFEAVLVKFDGIVLRIETRITKLNEQDISTTESQELLILAKKQIEDSNALIAASKIELKAAVTTETSREDIRNTIEICKTSLKKSQDALIAVIASLKSVEGSDEELSVE